MEKFMKLYDFNTTPFGETYASAQRKRLLRYYLLRLEHLYE